MASSHTTEGAPSQGPPPCPPQPSQRPRLGRCVHRLGRCAPRLGRCTVCGRRWRSHCIQHCRRMREYPEQARQAEEAEEDEGGHDEGEEMRQLELELSRSPPPFNTSEVSLVDAEELQLPDLTAGGTGEAIPGSGEELVSSPPPPSSGQTLTPLHQLSVNSSDAAATTAPTPPPDAPTEDGLSLSEIAEAYDSAMDSPPPLSNGSGSDDDDDDDDGAPTPPAQPEPMVTIRHLDSPEGDVDTY